MRVMLHNFCRAGFFAALFIGLFATACDNNTVNPDAAGEPPEIPPVSTFLMDFSDFQGSGAPLAKGLSGGTGDFVQSKQNWGLAALNVGVWNMLVVIGLAVPVASFVESFNHEPVQQPDGSWLWSYNFKVGGVQHTAKLSGKLVEGDVQWEMRISKQNAYNDFLWYSGVSNLPPTEGTWTLNQDPDNPTPLLGIEWHRDPQAGTGDIKYTNIVPNGPENGGYIFYGVTTNTPYDAFYDIFNKGKNNHTNIEWNRSTKEGHVKDPAHFSDDAWHCWNGTLDDIDCP